LPNFTMQQTPLSLIKHLAFSGKDYEEILQALEDNKQNFTEDSLESAKDKINDYIVKYQLASQVKSNALNQLIIGGVLFLVGLVITGGSYTFSTDGRYLLAYGLILGGAWTFKEGYKIYRLPLEDLVPRKSRFRR